jgi:hypothetical protein
MPPCKVERADAINKTLTNNAAPAPEEKISLSLTAFSAPVQLRLCFNSMRNLRLAGRGAAVAQGMLTICLCAGHTVWR